MKPKTILRTVTIVLLSMLLISGVVAATPWDISTISGGGKTVIFSDPNDITGVSFADNGSVLVITDKKPIYFYRLSQPYNVSTATLYATLGPTNNVYGAWFSPNGSEFYHTDDQSIIYQYHMDTPYDIDNASLVRYIDVSSDMGKWTFGIQFSQDGSKFVVTDYNTIHTYTLSTSWNISTATLTHTYSSGGQNIYGLHIGPDGHRLYISSINNDWIRQYYLTDSYNVSSAILNTTLSSPFYQKYPAGIAITKGGASLIVSYQTDDNLHVFRMYDDKVSGYITDKNGDYLSNTTVSNNQTSETYTTDSTGYYELHLLDGNVTITATKPNYVTSTKTVVLSGADKIANFTLTKEQNLSIITAKWMPYDTTAPINVLWGDKDVTQNSSIISSNTNIIIIKKAKGIIASTSNRSRQGVVKITASYNNKTVSQNVTVANRTIDNIGIMPPSQYIGAFLGLDEPGTTAGIGSSIEWLYLAIALGAFVSWQSRNEWLGTGALMSLTIVFWIMGHVSLGVVLISTFFGIFVLYQLGGVPSRSDTNVNQ